MWTIFIGFMGSGKTTVGGRLAAMAGRRFVDLDDLVVARAGLSIPGIFAAEEESGFRARELQALRSLPAAQNLVLATGGGLVESLDEPDFLRTRGCVFWLDMAWHTAWSRLQRTGDTRPLVAGRSPDELHGLFLRRRQAYAVAADFRLRTDLAGVEQVVRTAMVATLGWTRVKATA